jgi:serine/threonine protein kinase
VYLTPTHIAIVMEYAPSGDLFDYVCSKGKLNEDEVYSLIHTFLFKGPFNLKLL